MAVLAAPLVRARALSLRWPYAFTALAAAYLALAAAYGVAVPLWEAPDEPEHYQYVHYLRSNLALPAAPLPSVQIGGNEESNQPPLYYALAAAATFWSHDPAPAPRLN